MERRDVPATWISTGDTSFGNSSNWDTGTVPGNWGEVIFDGDYSTVSCTGVAGNLSVLALHADYTGTVTFSGAVVVAEASLSNGAIAQPSAGYTLTINGAFYWTGGVLNNTSTRSSVIIDGTFEAYPSAGVSTGSDLIFQTNVYEETTATFHTGSLDMTNGAGIKVDGDCVVQLLGIEIECLAPGGGGDPGIFYNKDGILKSATSNNKFTGKQFVNEAELEITQGTTFEIVAGGKNTPAFIQPTTASGAYTTIDRGCTLKAANGVTIENGTLNTRYVANPGPSSLSNIVTSMLSVSGSTTLVDLTNYEAPVNTPGTLQIHGSVDWQGGTYRTRVDADQQLGHGDRWYATDTFTLNGSSVVFDIINVGGELAPGMAWDIIRGAQGLTVQNGLPTLPAPYSLRIKPTDNSNLQVKI